MVVVMPTRSVHVAVIDFLRGGGAFLDHLDFEIQTLPSERMIRIERDALSLDRHDAHDRRVTILSGAKHVADLHFIDGQRLALDRLDLLVIPNPISPLGREGHTPLFARTRRAQKLFETVDDRSAPLEIDDGLLAAGGVEHLPAFVTKDVME